MKKCPSCGFNNSESRDRCLKCSTLLSTQPVPDGSHIADRPDAQTPLMVHVRRAMYWLGRKLATQLPTGVPHRFPWFAAWLSLIPGCGQLYNRQKPKAVIFAFIYAAMIYLVAKTFFIPASDAVCLLFVFWILYAMADGFVIAARINGDRWRLRHLVAVWFAFMFMVGAVLILGQAAGHGLFYLTTVRADTLAPQIRKGDKLFIWSTLVYRRLPPPGSVIYYNPARYYQYAPSGNLAGDDWVVNEQTSFEVVTASAGQTVECDASGVIRVDGKPVPPNLLPVNPNGMPHEWKMMVPDKAIGAAMSHGVVDTGLLGGAILAGTAKSPRAGQAEGRRIADLDNACVVRRPAKWGMELDGELIGVAVFCYYPPERRRWFGTKGLWLSPPPNYPEGRP
ncbi:zinc finger Ran-binding domain-containing family 2 protein [Candidatus Sumerlaeota bacterium]|nr:zinc finger Ran-binding domain-containing family 2 protein [Candidatus Sumerlaeota bacterium]